MTNKMRLILKNNKFNLILYQLKRFCNSGTVKKNAIEKYAADASLVKICPSWSESAEPALRRHVVKEMRVIPEFVSQLEETALLAELEPRLRRMRYEHDHWDNAIEGFRETERGWDEWAEEDGAASVMRRLRDVPHTLGGCTQPILDRVHVLDLAPTGYIKPHVDAVRFCGDVIAGVCLLSSAVMRLEHARMPTLALNVLLPARCLYVMSGVARYEFSHAVLRGEDSMWAGRHVRRGRRITLICRTQPPPPAPSTTPLTPEMVQQL